MTRTTHTHGHPSGHRRGGRAGLIAAAGLAATLAAPASLAQADADDRPDNIWAQLKLEAREFASLDEVTDADLVTTGDEEVGEVEDLLIDRGTGQAVLAVLEVGGFLGFGEEEVALAMDQLAWNSDGEAVTDLTEEAVESLLAFDFDDDLGDEVWEEQIRLFFDQNVEAIRDVWAGDEDPVADRITDQAVVKIAGEVVDVEREGSIAGMGGQTVVTLRSGGELVRVLAGPYWNLMSGGGAPSVGDTVTVTGYELTVANRAYLAGKEFWTEDAHLILRDADGNAEWALDAVPTRSGGGAVPAGAFILADEIEGMDVYTDWGEIGEVEDAVVELTSGYVLFLIVDIDDAGIELERDDERLVPFTAVSGFREGRVFLDASRTALRASLSVDDLDRLRDVDVFRDAFGAFDVRPPMLGMSGSSADVDRNARRFWDIGGVVAQQLGSPGLESKVIRGEVRGVMTNARPAQSVATLAVKIRTEDGLRTVHLGPSRHFRAENAFPEEGDRLVIDAAKIRTGVMEEAWVARRFRDRDTGDEVVLWNADGSPAWGSREVRTGWVGADDD